jgi:hypothetical protein
MNILALKSQYTHYKCEEVGSVVKRSLPTARPQYQHQKERKRERERERGNENLQVISR